MISESIDKAEEDFKARQVREARVEADTILAAVEKARRNDAWFDLSDEERRRNPAGRQRAAGGLSLATTTC